MRLPSDKYQHRPYSHRLATIHPLRTNDIQTTDETSRQAANSPIA